MWKRGNASRSSTRTSTPAFASREAVVDPPGPPPITMTSALRTARELVMATNAVNCDTTRVHGLERIFCRPLRNGRLRGYDDEVPPRDRPRDDRVDRARDDPRREDR